MCSSTLAAAARGVTTIVDMPPASAPSPTSEEALRAARRTAAREAFVDVGFWGAAVPGNLGSLAALRRAGAFGFVCSLSPSGASPHLDADQVRSAMTEVAGLGSRLVVRGAPSAVDAVIDAVRRLGFAPADDPKVAVAVMIEDGGGLGQSGTSNGIAAPIAKKVLEAVLSR